MKKLLILAILALSVGMQTNAAPPLTIPNSLLQDNNGGLYLDGGEIKTATTYIPVCVVFGGGTLERSTVEIYKDGRKERTLTGSFFLYHVIGEEFYYDVNVTVYTREGNTYTAHYWAYNSGLHLP